MILHSFNKLFGTELTFDPQKQLIFSLASNGPLRNLSQSAFLGPGTNWAKALTSARTFRVRYLEVRSSTASGYFYCAYILELG